METKRNKFNEQPQKKGGKDMTNVVLTAAGATIVGAGGALGATELLNDGRNEDDDLDVLDEELDEELEEQTAQTEDNTAEQTAQATAQQTTQPQQPPVQPDEMQPVDNGTTVTDNTTTVADNGNTPPAGNNGQQTGSETPVDPTLDDVNPDLIAQEITTEEVDPNDVDVADMIAVDQVGTVYTADGYELNAAAVHTADGGQYLMIDEDNDMTFDLITDLEGNPVVAVDGNLTMSDIEQEITTEEVDPNDVDVADMIAVDQVGTVYTADGYELNAAAVHTADGGQYLMIDEDNDMTFDLITDLEGNPVVAVDGNLTMSDIEDMMDETGDELAYNPEQDEMELAHGENPEDGIVDTEGDLAMADRSDEEDDSEGFFENIQDDDADDDLAMGDAVIEDDII